MRPEPLLIVALLAACNTAIGTEVSRSAARSVVSGIVAERFPGVPLEPATDCIIDNATGDEIVTVATAAATNDNTQATEVVLDVAQRPDTIRCLATDGLPVLLGGL